MSHYIIDYDLDIGLETATNSGIEWLKVDAQYLIAVIVKN